MSWSRRTEFVRFMVVLRMVLGEAARSPLVVPGWLLLTLIALALLYWTAEPEVWIARGKLFFMMNFALLSTGDILTREYRTRRALVMLAAGAGRRVHFLATASAWMIVFLVGSWAFGVVFPPWHDLSWRRLLGIALSPISLLPLLAAGHLLAVRLAGWLNVAVLLLGLLVLRIVGGYPETFGVLSEVATWVFAESDRANACAGTAPGGVSADVTTWCLRIFRALAETSILLVAGTLLAGTRQARRNLEEAAKVR